MIESTPLGVLFAILGGLLLLSAFFSGTETALMTLNRYRLRHLARSGHRGARITERLLRRPDRLIGCILLGNNLVNIAAASLTTLLSLRLGGESAVAAGTLILTVVILIFAEVAPKTMAALYPQRLALPAAFIYWPLLKLTYPIVWTLNLIANGVLRLLGIRPPSGADDALSSEELKTVVAEAGAMIPRRHQRMLLSILDLEKIAVDDVMVPRAEVEGVDLADPWEEVVQDVRDSRHSWLPVWRDDIDNIIGLLHVRTVIAQLTTGRLDEQALIARLDDPYFIPEGTSLNKQLVNFQRSRLRIALVVDEYGDVQGLVTMEDILREIVGELGTEQTVPDDQVTREADDCYLVSAAMSLRTLNRLMNWRFPTDGPRTLNGLILERLETIPPSGSTFELVGYPVEIVDTAEHSIRTVRVRAEPGDAHIP